MSPVDRSIAARILGVEKTAYGADPFVMRLRLPADTTVLVLPLATLDLPDGPIKAGDAVVLDAPRGSCTTATIRGVLVSKRDYRHARSWKGVRVDVSPKTTLKAALDRPPLASLSHQRRSPAHCPVCTGRETLGPGGNEHCDICHRVVEPGLTRLIADRSALDQGLRAICYNCDEQV